VKALRDGIAALIAVMILIPLAALALAPLMPYLAVMVFFVLIFGVMFRRP
jgi:hypothetical protein